MNKMKITKENIYINLQGKSKEELTELYWLLKNNNEKLYRDSLDLFLKYPGEYKLLKFDTKCWSGFDDYIMTKKQEVTIQQLKEILQPMENKEFDLKGYSVEVDNKVQAKQLQQYAFKQGFKWYQGKEVNWLNEKFFSFNAFNENRIHYGHEHFKDKYVTKEIHFNDIFKTEPTLTEQLEKAEAEVKRLKEAIEEESKPKVGDIGVFWDDGRPKKIGVLAKVYTESRDKYHMDGSTGWKNFEKIQDQELINKLNGLIK